MVTSNRNESHSVLEAQTINVLDNFTTGGRQIAGTRRSTGVSLASDLDYVRGKHSLRAGTQIDTLRLKSNESSNYLGTYTFESMDAFLAGTPRSFIRRIGDPNIAYSSIQAAVYVQDDIRVKKGLTLSPGVRYEVQNHLATRRTSAPDSASPTRRSRAARPRSAAARGFSTPGCNRTYSNRRCAWTASGSRKSTS